MFCVFVENICRVRNLVAGWRKHGNTAPCFIITRGENCERRAFTHTNTQTHAPRLLSVCWQAWTEWKKQAVAAAADDLQRRWDFSHAARSVPMRQGRRILFLLTRASFFFLTLSFLFFSTNHISFVGISWFTSLPAPHAPSFIYDQASAMSLKADRPSLSLGIRVARVFMLLVHLRS